jgi:hypothetical protein
MAQHLCYTPGTSNQFEVLCPITVAKCGGITISAHGTAFLLNKATAPPRLAEVHGHPWSSSIYMGLSITAYR